MESYPNELTEKKLPVMRCVNLDWLEVHAREPIDSPRDASYYQQNHMRVVVRDYGTRVYREMFTLLGDDGHEWLEIRRNPASQGLKGIHDPNECHLRLVNRACYFDNAAGMLRQFLDLHGYTDVRISRVDICMDFPAFDKGDTPQSFLRRYLRRKYSKINQGRIAAHGDDTWTGQEWNSLAWGSRTSAVTTKMYNKTMELYDVKMGRYSKPYIRESWVRCGFIDDINLCTLDGVKVDIWRVEFSLRSSVKDWIAIEKDGNEGDYHSIRNSLYCYDGRDKILVMFASLANHYFRFKKYRKNTRKDRCPDKILFDFTSPQVTYKIGKASLITSPRNQFHESFTRLIGKIRMYQQSHSSMEIFKACETLIQAMTEDDLRNDLANPWSREDLMTLRLLMQRRSDLHNESFEVAMTEIRKLLKIHHDVSKIF